MKTPSEILKTSVLGNVQAGEEKGKDGPWKKRLDRDVARDPVYQDEDRGVD